MSISTLPAIGIVVTAFNAEKYISKALTCIREQDYPSPLMDVVVVDDGSKDGTASVARKTLENSPFSWRVIFLDDRGPSAARNVGWRTVRGDWIQFVDADDWFATTKLKIQGPDAGGVNSSVAVVFSAWQRISADGAPGKILRPSLGEDVLCDLLKSENFMQVASQLFHRPWLERVGGFDEKLSHIEDVELALRLAMAGGGFAEAPSTEPLSFYYARSNSMSRRNSLEFVHGIVRNARMVEKHWAQTQGKLREPQRKVLLEIYGEAMRFYSQNDNAAFKTLWHAVKEIAPDYRPNAGLAHKLTPIIGYQAAERTAGLIRKFLGRP